MNRIDKLLFIAKSNQNFAYTLVCTLIPETDNKMKLIISLQNRNNVVEYNSNYFSNKEQCDEYIKDFCRRYNLTDNNTLKIFLDIVSVSNEVL